MTGTVTSTAMDISDSSESPGTIGTGTTTAARTGHRRWEAGLPWLTTIIIIGAQELLARTGLLPKALPPFTDAVRAAWRLVPTSEFGASLVATIEQLAIGLAAGVVIGVTLGVAVGSVPLLHTLTHYVLDFLRFIPAVVYLPVLVLVMGATPRASIVLAAVGTTWPMLFQTYYGVVGVPRILRDTGRVFGLRPHQRLVQIILPAVSPFIATGLRIAALHALVVVVAVQIITTVDGLGHDIAVYATNGVYPEMYALVGIVGLLGVLINALLELLEHRQLHWHSSHRETRI